jgi:hypothetical protein
MTEDYAGRQVAGMDLHRRRSALVRVTEDGWKLEDRQDHRQPGHAAPRARPCRRHPDQPHGGQHRPSGGQVGDDTQERCPGGPPGPGQHPRAQRAP